MPGPTPNPEDDFVKLLVRRAALLGEIEANPTDRTLQDELTRVDSQIAALQSQLARGATPGGPTPAGMQAGGGPTPTPGPMPGAGGVHHIAPGGGPATRGRTPAPTTTPAAGGGGSTDSDLLAGMDPYIQSLMQQAQVSAGRLALDEEELRYKIWSDNQARMHQEGKDAVDRLMTRLQYEGRSGGMSPGLSYAQALPYMLAPGTQYIPGFEPGGPWEAVYNRSGWQYNPEQYRTIQMPIAQALPAPPVEWPSWMSQGPQPVQMYSWAP